MKEKIVRFSRLLRIFDLNESLAFIVELEENGQKNLYISYGAKDFSSRFESYHKTKLKKEFENLSDHCLMSQCTEASCMFLKSHITHFEADCSSLLSADSMFDSTSLCFLDAQFPLLEDANKMFRNSKIKEINIDFPTLKNGNCMFSGSSLEIINTKFPKLEYCYEMFLKTPLKEINCKFPKIKGKVGMFNETPPELKQNYPYYFI